MRAEVLTAASTDPMQPEFLNAPSGQEYLHDVVRLLAASPSQSHEDPAVALERQRNRLSAIIGTGAAMHPAMAETINAYGDYLQYAWYAEYGATRPDKLERDTSTYRIELADTDYDALNTLLEPFGLHDLVQDRHSNLNTNRDTLEEAVRESLRGTAGYRWLASFATETPAEEVALTEAQIDAIAAPHQNALLRKMDLGSRTQTMQAPGVRQRVEHIRYQAEQATTKRMSTPQDASQQSFMKLRNQCQAILNSYCKKHKLKGLVYDDNRVDDVYFRASDKNLGYAAQGILTSEGYLSNQNDQFNGASDNLIKSAMRIFGLSTIAKTSYMEWLDVQVGQVAADLTRNLIRDASPLEVGFSTTIDILKNVVDVPKKKIDYDNLFSASPVEAAYFGEEPESNNQEVPDYIDDGKLGFTSLQRLLADGRTRTGTVQKRPNEDHAGRMLIKAPAIEGLPSVNPFSADTVIVMKRPTEGVYLMDGYNLVGVDSDRRRFAYRYDPTSDPYTPCLTPMTEEQLKRATESAKQAQMERLASELEAAEDLTVADFFALLGKYLRYHAPDKRARRADAYDTPKPKSSADLAAYVNPSTGTMRAQCDITGEATKIFIREADLGLAGDRIGTLVGSAGRWPFGGKIGRNLHQQVAFIDGTTGKLHIIDITPPLNMVQARLDAIGSRIGNMVTGNLAPKAPKTNTPGVLGRLAARFANKPQDARFAQATASTTTHAAAPRKERVVTAAERSTNLTRNYQEVVVSMGKAFGTKNFPMPAYAVKDRVAHLPARDLLRITMEIVEATVGTYNCPIAPAKTSYGRAVGMLEYIDGLRKKPGAFRDPYNYATKPHLLNVCEHALRQVAANTAPTS